MFRALSRVQATPLRTQALGGKSTDGAWLVHWRNADSDTAYEQPDHHTLSLYLEGGQAVRCLDHPAARGAPGSLCCFPAGHHSRWAVRGELQLLHLYLPRLPLALAAEQWFDRDPRLADLDDRIYFDDDALARLGREIVALDWRGTDATLRLQELGLQMQARLLQVVGRTRRPLAIDGIRIGMTTPPPAVGGLSSSARRRVLDAIESAVKAGQPVDLDTLAAQACLSTFHFARMFKQSFGLPPHAWVMQRRLARARALLARPQATPAGVAAEAGYAHVSHLNRALRGAGLGSAQRWRRVNTVTPAAA